MLSTETVQQLVAAISAMSILRAYQFGVDGLPRARASRSVFEVAIYDDVVIVLEVLGSLRKKLMKHTVATLKIGPNLIKSILACL